mgnify:CR=1 FL=1|jgi:ATP adenylyltransferase
MKEKNNDPHGIQKLWAPWRMEYIDGIEMDKKEVCIFCEKPAENEDEKNFIVYRGKTCFIILNKYPYNNGHLMVVPYKHTSELADLDSETKLELMNLIELTMKAIRNVMRPDGFNVGINFGRTAGAGITSHLHIHIVPRWNGDTNFMPIIGSAKIISEALADTYKKLKNAFENI